MSKLSVHKQIIRSLPEHLTNNLITHCLSIEYAISAGTTIIVHIISISRNIYMGTILHNVGEVKCQPLF